jgi:toxin YoeB
VSYSLQITNDAIEDIEYLKKTGDKAILKKLATLLEELTDQPYTGTGQPEELKYNFSGCWSRRISNKHRLVYIIEEERKTVIVLYSRGHYADK